MNARRTNRQVVSEIDRLLSDHTEAGIAEILNDCGFRSGIGQPFSTRMVAKIRVAYELEARFSRLRRRGFLTQEELASRLGVSTHTVKAWYHAGLLVAHDFDTEGGRLYDATVTLPSKMMGRPLRHRPRPVALECPDEVQCSA